MIDTRAPDVEDDVVAIEQMLDHEVRPALSAHAGNIRLTLVTEDTAQLEMVGSCARCYFRRSCVENLVRPSLAQTVGSRRNLLVTNVRS